MSIIYIFLKKNLLMKGDDVHSWQSLHSTLKKRKENQTPKQNKRHTCTVHKTKQNKNKNTHTKKKKNNNNNNKTHTHTNHRYTTNNKR